MSERITNEELNHSRRLYCVVSSVLTTIVTISLEKIIKSSEKIRTFLTRNFKSANGIDSGNRYLIRVDEALEIFENENKRFPNSLFELNLDITNLCAIWINLLEDNYKPSIDFFLDAKSLRNFCNHTTGMTAEVFVKKCNELRKLIISCPHIQQEFKTTYLEEMNFMLENLRIIDDQSLNKKFQELEKKFDKQVNLMTREFNEKLNLMKKSIEKNQNEMIQKIEQNQSEIIQEIEQNQNEMIQKLEKNKKVQELSEKKFSEDLKVVIKRIEKNKNAISDQKSIISIQKANIEKIFRINLK